MQRVVVDANLFRVLPGLTVAVELVDAAGNAIGVYTPDSAAAADIESGLAAEELAAAAGGRTLAEIMADLEGRSP